MHIAGEIVFGQPPSYHAFMSGHAMEKGGPRSFKITRSCINLVTFLKVRPTWAFTGTLLWAEAGEWACTLIGAGARAAAGTLLQTAVDSFGSSGYHPFK